MRLRRLLAPAGTMLVLACGSGGPDPGSSFNLTCVIPTEDVFSGGAARDGIPALSFPLVVPASDADFLDDDERVLGVFANGRARAYPLGILWWHEVVNDFLAEQPVLLTYCPLTGSGIAFDPNIDGAIRNFGVSGLLFENNLTMFDRQSETLWNQMLLGGVCGPDRGRELPRIPVVETTWGYWRAMHPTTTIVSLDTGFSQPYGIYPYGDYAKLNNPATLFPSSQASTARLPKELVLGVERGADVIAYPFGEFEELGEVVALNEVVGDRPLLITYKTSEHTAMAFDRVVDGQELTFTVADTVRVRFQDAETGSIWDRKGEAVEGPLAGTQLVQFEDAYAVYWFAWSIFHPATQLYLAGSD